MAAVQDLQNIQGVQAYGKGSEGKNHKWKQVYMGFFLFKNHVINVALCRFFRKSYKSKLAHV